MSGVCKPVLIRWQTLSTPRAIQVTESAIKPTVASPFPSANKPLDIPALCSLFPHSGSAGCKAITAADDVDKLFLMNAISFAVPSVTHEGANLCRENEELGEILTQRKTRSGACILRRSLLIGYGLLPQANAVVSPVS